MSRTIVFLLVLLLFFMSLTACAEGASSGYEQMNSDLERLSADDVTGAEIQVGAESINEFAVNLYQEMAVEKKNIFFSPYSIETALTMVYAGSAGETASQMQEVLHLQGDQVVLHRGMNALAQTLEKEDAGFILKTANSLWGDKTGDFKTPFLDILALYYGAGVNLVDFIHAPEESRTLINRWVEDETDARITDLMPEGSIDTLTRLVLANAVYFKAQWADQFFTENTKAKEFTTLSGEKILIPMMNRTGSYRYASGENWRALELPYKARELSMLIILPDDIAAFERSFTYATLHEIDSTLTAHSIELSLPRFSFEYGSSLIDFLKALGMSAPFSANADFSGISAHQRLTVTAVEHKAFIAVDEEGTEAAAATGVGISLTSIPDSPLPFVIDAPFLLLIREKDSGVLLFLGRVGEKSAFESK